MAYFNQFNGFYSILSVFFHLVDIGSNVAHDDATCHVARSNVDVMMSRSESPVSSSTLACSLLGCRLAGLVISLVTVLRSGCDQTMFRV